MSGEEFHCNGNISCFFEICESEPALRKQGLSEQSEDAQSASRFCGSTGCGINTDKGVLTKVSEGKGILINRKESEAPTSKAVLRRFTDRPVHIEHETEIPVSYGFGASGSGALSLSFSLNKFLKKNLSKEECIRIAHESEVECRTGLGDVIGIANGDGVGLKTKSGLEGLRPENRIKIPSADYTVCALFKGILETKKVLGNRELSKKIKEVGSICTRKLASEPTQENLIKLSRWFTKETGLWSNDVRRVMEAVPETSMIMLGNAVYCLTDEPEKKAELLRKYSENIIVCRVVRNDS